MKLVFGKLQQWQVLPWKLAALAHWDKEVVRATARKVLALLDAAPLDQDVHHRLAWKWLFSASPLRPHVEALSTGANLDDLPELRQHVYELLFLPLDERVEEREHSLTTQTIGRRAAGPAYRSLILRSRELDSILSDSQALE